MPKKRNIGWIALFAIASGTMISSGIFILPGLAYGRTGSYVPLVYLLAGFVALLASLALIELATAMPRAGGDYFYITRSMGPGVGTIMGLLSWLALMLKTAFAVFGLAELVFVLTGFPLRPVALIITALFLLINLSGTSEAVGLEVLLVFFLLIIMTAFTLFGLGFLDSPNLWVGFPGGRLSLADSTRRITAGAAYVFVSFGGLLNVSTMAEEVKEPGKSIPRAILVSVLIVSLLYFLMVLITTALLPPEDFSGSLTPISDAATRMVGSWGGYLVIAASALAFATTGNAGMMSASRYPLAMARDGLMPESLGHTTKKQVPTRALLLTAVTISVAVLIPLDALVQLASTVVLISYMAINAAVIILRESGMRNYKPLYSLPGYPFIPLV